MTIEIISTNNYTIQPTNESFRSIEIVVTSGAESYLWSVGGLPPVGDLQAILDAREAELFAVAAAGGRAVDLYEIDLKRVLKAVALVVMDEINILRQQAGLPLRTAGQMADAIKARLKGLA